MDNTIATIVGAVISGGLVFVATRQRNNIDAAKNMVDAAANKSTSEIQYADSVMRFADKKDIEINAQALRITTLETANAAKDRQIALLTQEGFDKDRQIAKLTARLDLLEDLVEGMRDMWKRGLMPAGNTSTVMTMGMGMATSVNPTTPQTPPLLSGDGHTVIDGAKVEIVMDVHKSDTDDEEEKKSKRLSKPKKVEEPQ